MIRYRALPPECFAAVTVPDLGEGATNEDLARAFSAMRDRAESQAVVLDRCAGMSAGQ